MNPSSTPLSKATCLIHPGRAATARCPGCGTFYCSECITEHEGKLTCARCLAAEYGSEAGGLAEKRRLPLMPLAQLAVGLAVCWLIYYCFAKVLLSVPAPFHDGTVWE